MKKVNICSLAIISMLIVVFLQGCSRTEENHTNITSTPASQSESYQSTEPSEYNYSKSKEELKQLFVKEWGYRPANELFVPVIDGENVIVYGPHFTCLDRRTCEIKWIQDKITGPIDSYAIAYDSSVIAFTNGEGLVILDKSTGEVIATYRTRKETYSKPAIKDNIVFFTAREGELYGVDKNTGQLVWEFWPEDGLPGMSILSDPVIIGDSIFFEAIDNLYAVDLLAKKEKWKIEELGLSYDYISILTSNDNIFIIEGYEQKNIYCIDSNNGKVIWKKSFEISNYCDKVLISDGYLYICGQDTYIYKISEIDGSIAFTYEINDKSEKICDIGITDERVFYITGNALYSIDKNGKNLMKYEVEEFFKGKIHFVDNELYLTDENKVCKYVMNTGTDGNIQSDESINTGDTESYNNRMFTKDSIKIGQRIAGLTVKSIDRSPTSIEDVTFSGEVVLNGTYEWYDTEYYIGCSFDLDENSIKKLPFMEGLGEVDSIRINNIDLAEKLLTQKSGQAKIVIKNYSIGEREIIASADLVKLADD